jgi:hypothetical protein
MSKTNKLPRTAVLDCQIAAMEKDVEPLDEQALEQVKGGLLVLPMYGVPFIRGRHFLRF